MRSRCPGLRIAAGSAFQPGEMNASALIASLESVPVGDGDLVGEPLRTLPYQRRFLRGASKPRAIPPVCPWQGAGGRLGWRRLCVWTRCARRVCCTRRGSRRCMIAASFTQAELGLRRCAVVGTEGEYGDYRIRDQQNLADIQHK